MGFKICLLYSREKILSASKLKALKSSEVWLYVAGKTRRGFRK